jgi:hypothetical protein
MKNTDASHQTVYVTYDLPQVQHHDQKKQPVIRGAKQVSIPGKLLQWKIGEHETSSGKKVSGVRIVFSGARSAANPEDPSLPEHLQSATQTPHEQIEIIEVPGHAAHIRLHQGRIPDEYQAALKEAA